MREMVLNHASLQAPDRYSAVKWLRDVMIGMQALVDNGVAQENLRMTRSIYEVNCLTNRSPWDVLFDALRELRGGGARDELALFLRLTSKLPLLGDMDQDISRCEVVGVGGKAKMLSLEDSAPLKFCADTNAIAVGFPSGIWNCDQITVNGEAPNAVDNLTRSVHARAICERHRATLPQPKNFAELWETRGDRFPCLKFGLDVERQLARLDTTVLQTAIKRLQSLNESAREWCIEGGAISWRCEVTDESNTVKEGRKWREKRRFKSCSGKPELFFLHTNLGNKMRIHVRVYSRTIEIGYIGPHLPIPTA